MNDKGKPDCFAKRVAVQDKSRWGWVRAVNFLLTKNVIACAECFLFAENSSATNFSFAKLFFSAKSAWPRRTSRVGAEMEPLFFSSRKMLLRAQRLLFERDWGRNGLFFCRAFLFSKEKRALFFAWKIF